jgi:hypothetical protein
MCPYLSVMALLSLYVPHYLNPTPVFTYSSSSPRLFPVTLTPPHTPLSILPLFPLSSSSPHPSFISPILFFSPYSGPSDSHEQETQGSPTRAESLRQPPHPPLLQVRHTTQHFIHRSTTIHHTRHTFMSCTITWALTCYLSRQRVDQCSYDFLVDECTCASFLILSAPCPIPS